MAVVIALAAWEWAEIAGFGSRPARVAYTLLIIFLLAVFFVFRFSQLSLWLITLSLFWWAVAIGLVLAYQKQTANSFKLPLPAAVIGILVLVPPWLSLIVLHSDEPDGAILVLFLLVLIWSADIAAFFCGRRWGKNKLASRVSPGKSWEGLYGALAASGVMALIYASYRQIQGSDLLIFTGICLITVLASILGDLLESLMKRIASVKDSGSLLPGHGGVLDRIDSLTAALPVFLGTIWLWEKLT